MKYSRSLSWRSGEDTQGCGFSDPGAGGGTCSQSPRPGSVLGRVWSERRVGAHHETRDGGQGLPGPGDTPSLTKPRLSWSRLVRLQNGQVRGRADTTGNSEAPEESKESLRKEGWRGNGKGRQGSFGQDAGDLSSASDWLCDLE